MMHRMQEAISARNLAGPGNPVLLMVSGGSDSTALAYLAADLRDAGGVGPLAMLHVNHRLRGADSDADAAFVAQVADALRIPLFLCEVDIGALVDAEGGNMEAIARRERYQAAREALASLCAHTGFPLDAGRIFTAHTADDRVENFYMRSIVGTGPGGFRSMTWRTGEAVRPLLGASRDDLRAFLRRRAEAAAAASASAESDAAALDGASCPCVVRDGSGALWREDATNACTDGFRSFVRHKIVPQAKERNPRLLETLCRTMDLIADEDDMLARYAASCLEDSVSWESQVEGYRPEYDAGCVLMPSLASQPVPIRRRVVAQVLSLMLGLDARVESSSVDAVLAAFADAAPHPAAPSRQNAVLIGGYTANIQGNLAVSANKHGIRIEPMAAYRARRKRG